MSPSKGKLGTVSNKNRRLRDRRRGKQRRPRYVAGVSTLMYAAQQGDVDVVRKIIGVESSSLFQRDRTGKTALHYTSTSSSRCASQAADLMVMAAPELVDGRDEDGFTPLHLAVIAVCGETAALRAVLAAGARVSTPDVHGGYPLHYAAQMCGGDRDSNLGMQVLQTLLSHPEIKVSETDVDKRQPLLWAASAGSSRAVLALIRAGANVEASDKDGLTALHCAASRGHTDCMDTLLTLCGASVDVIDTNGCTALHYAVTLGHADATALLLAHGADPNRQDRKGRSPAHCGCAKGQFETVKLIGVHGANLWLRNARGDLPLHDAAGNGRRELVKWLLEMRPSQVNARNNDGRCPLHMAALNDNADMCKILLDNGAQVNPVLRTSKNVFMTPLDCALQRGYRSTAKYLQLQGGVPASRLNDPKQSNSALNFHIRDDVTFYGDVSSESEKEIKKTVKKKKVSMSSSEISEREKSTKSRIDYSNEITINGKTEVKISENKEIIFDKESVQTQTSAKLRENSKRDKSAQSSLNKEPMISISSQATVSKIDHSTCTTTEEINQQSTSEENEETKKDILVEAAIHPQPKSIPDDIINDINEENVNVIEKVQDDIDVVVEKEKLTKNIENLNEISNYEKIEDETQPDLGDFVQITDKKEIEIEEEAKKIGTMENIPNEVNKTENNTKEIAKTTDEIKTDSIEDKTQPELEDFEQIIDKKEIEIEEEAKNIDTIENIPIEVNKTENYDTEEIPKTTVEVTNDKIENLNTEPSKNEVKDESVKQNKENFSDIKIKRNKENEESSSSDDDEFSSKSHKSFRVLRDEESNYSTANKTRSKSLDKKSKKDKLKSKIPTPLFKSTLSKSDRHLNEFYKETNLDTRIPSLPNIRDERNTIREHVRCDSNMSAPMLTSILSDKDKDSLSEMEDEIGTKTKRFVKKRSRNREARSAGSDYESSNLIDSGFEPSPRSTRTTKWKNMSDRGVNMASVTQNIQTNIRRYHLERKIFQQLLELKRHQIRAGQHNEAVLVKRAVEAYHKSCASTVGVGRYTTEDYTFKSFEKFLYEALRKLQKNGAEYMRGLPANPLLCTKSTNRCMHAAHAYTGVPCAAYLPKMDHHSIPKIGFDSVDCKPGTGRFLPTINPKKTVTLELTHGTDKQVISLPTNKLDQNKRYYVTFTVKGHEAISDDSNNDKKKVSAHKHSKSD
ncbi:ankyrin repeat, PH and SEC7 domain containing protein secG isoform X2 [Diorhabda carinulata]|uniref:ankyrin repeat, PH and SEC7 domain containing protein secG isoform X2 n=2 Tax=Diorhabda carinulata TaxID=1163345 RepID=UPI0025A0AAC5|nr:ankyrin repeat, PH and SEC7 domain containing protein secG isoform X2 [Diorhabda carinulata]